MQIKAHIINAFAHNNMGGNPAGVVLNADDLTNERKQAIASKMGMSETAFVSNSTIADFKLDFFTPSTQIPHCGHATIATFSYLKQTGRIGTNQSSKETIDGTRSIYFEGDKAYMEQGSPKYFVPDEDTDIILSSLGLHTNDVTNGLQPTIVNTGNSFLLIPLNEENALQNLHVNFEAVAKLSEKYGLVGFYPYTTNVTDPRFDATTRMFGPYFGIREEAATGMAAGPLACFLYKNGLEKTSINIEQGRFMSPPSPSLLNVILMEEGGEIKKSYAGGKAYYVAQKTIEI